VRLSDLIRMLDRVRQTEGDLTVLCGLLRIAGVAVHHRKENGDHSFVSIITRQPEPLAPQREQH
jgi:hypothetical protein